MLIAKKKKKKGTCVSWKKIKFKKFKKFKK